MSFVRKNSGRNLDTRASRLRIHRSIRIEIEEDTSPALTIARHRAMEFRAELLAARAEHHFATLAFEASEGETLWARNRLRMARDDAFERARQLIHDLTGEAIKVRDMAGRREACRVMGDLKADCRAARDRAEAAFRAGSRVA